MTRSTFAGISEWAGQAAQVTTGVAGLSYAFGWVLMARFYGALGVEPEDVGITFAWLVARAFLVGVLALVAVLSVRWLQLRSTSASSTKLVVSVGNDVRSYIELKLPFNGRYLLRVIAGILAGFLITLLVLLPFYLGDRLATDARAGRSVDFGLLGISAIRTAQVRLISADPDKPIAAAGCVIRLGSNAGTSLFIVDGYVVRVSDQNATVTSPC